MLNTVTKLILWKGRESIENGNNNSGGGIRGKDVYNSNREKLVFVIK